MEFYAIPGETQQYFCKARQTPSGAVLMNEKNPGGLTCSTDGCASGFGVWKEGIDAFKKKAYLSMVGMLEVGVEFYGVHYQASKNNVDDLNLALLHMERKGTLSIFVRATDDSMHELAYDSFKSLVIKVGDLYDSARRGYWEDVDGF